VKENTSDSVMPDKTAFSKKKKKDDTDDGDTITQ